MTEFVRSRRGSHSGGEATRNEIFEAAKKAFLRHGPDKTTNMLIAKLAEKHLSAIAYHFGNRDSILALVRKEVKIPEYEELLAHIQKLEKIIYQEKSYPKDPSRGESYQGESNRDLLEEMLTVIKSIDSNLQTGVNMSILSKSREDTSLD